LIEINSKKKSEVNKLNIHINYYKINFLFLFCAILFYLFPWSEDRESRMAQIAALFRAIWFIICVIKLNGTKQDYYLLFLCLLLMIIDTSRSTFASIFIVHLLRRSGLNLKIAFLITISVLGVASMRSFTFNSSDLFNSLFLYGFFGEGVNGALGVFQLFSSEYNLNTEILTIIFTFLQPLFTPIKLIFGSNFPFFDSSYFHSTIVKSSINEEYYPMAGFYLVSEFIKLQYIGAILFIIYVNFSSWLSSKIFPFKDPAVRFTLIFLMLKMSPYTYWKWIYYICIVYFLLTLILRKFRLAT
jgi:hypothetical protein